MPELELIIVRDPDGDTEVEAFLDGKPVNATEFVIDPGRGWTPAQWREARREALELVSEAAGEALVQHYEFAESAGNVSWDREGWGD